MDVEQVTASGFTLSGLEFRPHQSDTQKEQKLQASSLNFVPYGTRSMRNIVDIVSLGLQFALDTQPTAELVLSVIHLNDGTADQDMNVGNLLLQLATDRYNVEIDPIELFFDIHNPSLKLPIGVSNVGLILSGSTTLSAAVALLDSCPSAIILAHYKSDDSEALEKLGHLKILAGHIGESGRCVLLRPSKPQSSQSQVMMVPPGVVVPASLHVSSGAVLVWSSMPSIGVQAVVDAVSQTPGGTMVRMVFILDANAPTFSTEHPLYRDQLALGMRINVLKDGVWGSLKILPLPMDAHNIPNGRDTLLTAVSTQW